MNDLEQRVIRLEDQRLDLARKLAAVEGVAARGAQNAGMKPTPPWDGTGSDRGDLVYALTGAGGLTAYAAGVLGSGVVTLYAKAGANLTLGSVTATCYSGSTAVVGAGGKLIGMTVRADGSGAYDCVAEFC